RGPGSRPSSPMPDVPEQPYIPEASCGNAHRFLWTRVTTPFRILITARYCAQHFPHGPRGATIDPMSHDAYGTPTSEHDGPEPVAYTLWAVLRRDPAAEPLLTRLLGNAIDASATSVPQETVVELLEAAASDLTDLVEDLPEGVGLRDRKSTR